MAIITGTNVGETLNGNAGENDTINGLGGNDLLFGDTGTDILNGGNGNDRFRVNSQAEIAVSETYNGGAGFDILDLETADAINLSSLIINADVERLESNGAVSLTAAQLGNFTNVNTGAITLTDGGLANLTDATVFTATFNLSAANTTFNLTNVQTTAYTVNGGNGSDIITGGDHVSGDTLNGGGGDDTLNGGAGARLADRRRRHGHRQRRHRQRPHAHHRADRHRGGRDLYRGHRLRHSRSGDRGRDRPIVADHQRRCRAAGIGRRRSR